MKTIALLSFLGTTLMAADLPASIFDVKGFGARGDGVAQDTAAINKALDAARAAGSGTVYLPAGTYLSGSIHLQSNVTFFLGAGSTLLATNDPLAYDEPEPNQWDKFQDYGHSHFHNSLIWGENLENGTIMGPGRI